MTLLLKHFDDWEKLINPDVFCVTAEREKAVEEVIWR